MSNPLKLILLVLVGSSIACDAPAKDTTPGAQPGSAPHTVVFATSAGDVPVTVEVADDPAERSQGLMHRQSLAPNAGMLFIFPSESTHPFWMKNTHVSLDMIWLAADKRVVGIKADTEPLSTESLSPGEQSKYVVEVNAGFAHKHGIKPGVVARFENIDDQAR